MGVRSEVDVTGREKMEDGAVVMVLAVEGGEVMERPVELEGRGGRGGGGDFERGC